jgi:glutamine synthetase
VSIRDGNGDNIFAIKPEELNGGREGAAYNELKYISQIAEYFLAGVLHGLTDGKSIVIHGVEMTLSYLKLCPP